MGQEADVLTRLISAKRDELDYNISRLQKKVRSGAWKWVFALVAAFSLGLVVSSRKRRRAPQP